ncbi:hypothetical protein RB653_005377 [Dictyostelium firmibasis]|uniref:ADP-ribosylation factor n=1 Tax=Dictyostelium firmibasis TaxID=79012 RepID=A0AAN7Z109_9MYCE
MINFLKNYLKPKYTILLLGQNGTGKTSLVNKLVLDENPSYVPTIGFGIEVIEFKNYNIQVWDCDLNTIRVIQMLVKNFYLNNPSPVIIFFIDSTSDETKLKESGELINILFLNEIHNEDSLLLIFANKQDLPNAMNITNLIDILGLHRLVSENQLLPSNNKIKWSIQPCSVKRGDGIYEGFNWIEENLKK